MHEQSEIAGPSNLAGGRTAREKKKKKVKLISQEMPFSE
jgi:hypothetical protein